MWATTASLERAFRMGKQLIPPHKSSLKLSTIVSHLLIKIHFMIYREKRERCYFSKRIPINLRTNQMIVHSRFLDESAVEGTVITEEFAMGVRSLRHELR
ncbi:hypothetical protein LOD99_3057 [Oopsacas minuta]|uniref:HAT C-terminal dimerisation domain-containing protein n=1 Tax=Oopsacas minuta TaxID=111878 RepID=A0AAV7JYW1_9METZ|nr:hypothetical protein LOD99_3057 [Oopsacas minuta]